MRRTLALLALLATSWPHVVVLECALGSRGPATAHEAGEHGHHGGGDAHHGGGDAHHAGDNAGHAGHRAEAPSDGPLGGTQCAMVMACGLVMIRAGDDAAEEVAPRSAGDARVRTLSSPAAVDLVAETPPPRPSA